MTRDELYQGLREAVASGVRFAAGWKGQIRDGEARCPLCTLARFKDPWFPYYEMYAAARDVLGTDLTLTLSVVRAADNPAEPGRRELEEACGL